MAACGLDFGTSNTTLGHPTPSGPRLAALEDGHLTLPSAVFFEPGREPLVGRAAGAAYVAGRPGRLMRGLKSVLGTPLAEESTPVGRARLRFRDVIARFVGEAKARAEARIGVELDRVVHGRPVHFLDGDPEGDRRAEATLGEIAHAVGFREVTFQYEPIAAALDYERGVGVEEIALIADIGGGTSDFSIVRLSPERHGRAERGDDILANHGVRVGGTDFDRWLSLGTVMPLLGLGSPMRRGDLAVPSAPFHDLATWSRINRLYDRRAVREIEEVVRDCARPDLVGRLLAVVEGERGHALAAEVEGAKIAASDAGRARLDLACAEAGLAAEVDRASLAAQTASLAARVGACVDACLAQAGLPAGRVDALFLTGGSTGLPHVRAALTEKLPEARAVAGDTFGSVGLGLTIEAARRWG